MMNSGEFSNALDGQGFQAGREYFTCVIKIFSRYLLYVLIDTLESLLNDICNEHHVYNEYCVAKETPEGHDAC